MTLRNHHCDVLIAGGGPAGLAAGIALRLRGADVIVADALRPPIDKPCGEGLMPEARRALAALGVSADAHGVLFRGIAFAAGDTRVAADFPSTLGIGMRRTVLHQLLWERAAALGIRFFWNSPVILNQNQPPVVAGHTVAARWIVGADGASSRIRAWAGLDHGRVRSRRFGFRAHFRLAAGVAAPVRVEVHWGAHGQAYLTPTAPHEVCLSAMTRDPRVRLPQVLAGLPALRALLHNAELLTVERGCLTLTRRLRRVVRGSVALVGDASGSVDAITGEGLALAFRQAMFLADSLSMGNLTHYARRHSSALVLPQRMARVLLLLDRFPHLRDRTLRALAAEPALFEALLAVHVGERELRDFVFEQGALLASGILRGGKRDGDAGVARTERGIFRQGVYAEADPCPPQP